MKGLYIMKKTKQFLSALAIIALLCALVSCGAENDPWASAQYTEDTVIGEGTTTLTFIVQVLENSVTFNVKTDKKILGDALMELGLIDGTVESYGLYVKEVNGITADYDKDQRYWALYVNDAYASSGVDTTEIKAGEIYKFVYSK
jgi:phosphomannomutase